MSPPDCYHLCNACRICGSGALTDFLHFPAMPVAGLYCRKPSLPATTRTAPMTLTYCEACGLVQLREIINPEIYREYHFSGTYNEAYVRHLDWVAKHLIDDYNLKGKTVLEIGASSGDLLKYLKAYGCRRVRGFEPSLKVTQGLDDSIVIIQDYFNQASIHHYQVGAFDCIIMRHVLEHLDNLHEAFLAMKSCLAPNGLLVLEVPDLGAIISKKIYTNIFHEHLNYFSLNTLVNLAREHGFRLLSHRSVDIHGGSILAVFTPGEENLRPEQEPSLAACRVFGEETAAYFAAIHTFVRDVAGKGEITGYGASHRTFVFLSCAGIGERISKIYDQNELLQGKFLCGYNIPIETPKQLAADSSGYLIVFALAFEEEIIALLRSRYAYRGKIISIRESPRFVE